MSRADDVPFGRKIRFRTNSNLSDRGEDVQRASWEESQRTKSTENGEE